MKISLIKYSIHIDPLKMSCDVKFIETIDTSFETPTDMVYYVIISRKLLFKDFTPSLPLLSTGEDVLKIEKYEVFNDLSYKQRTFYDRKKKNISFRDKWLLTIKLNKPVLSLEFSIEYYSERGLLVDTLNENNVINLSFFNPYNDSIEYIIFIVFHKVSSFEIKRMSVPQDAVITTKGEDSEVFIYRRFQSFTYHSISIFLPIFISNCDGAFVNFLFFGLILSSTVFGLFSLLTVIYLYKE